MALTPPPPAPSTLDPGTFAARMDAHIAWMAVNVAEYTALNIDVPAVILAQNNAGNYAAAAANSAASASNAPGTSATSTTSTLVGIGNKTLTVATGKTFPIGATVKIVRTSDVGTWMMGNVVSYDSVTTGQLVVSVLTGDTSGSGTFTDWTISISAPRSAQSGTLSTSLETLTAAPIASAATINLNAIVGNRVHVTGSAAITAVTLTKGPKTVIFDGVLTLTHNATTNNLPGAADITTAAGDRAVYESDGTVVYCISYTKANGQAIIGASSTFIPITTAGTTSALTLTTAGNLALATNESFMVTAHVNTTATATLNRDAKGAKNLRQYNPRGAKVPAGLVSGCKYLVVYDGTDYIVFGTLGSAGATNVGEKGIYAYGNMITVMAVCTHVTNIGVMSSDEPVAGTARSELAGAQYGTDKVIMAYGVFGATSSLSNLVSNVGVISNDVTGVGTARSGILAAKYGTDKAVFAYGVTSTPTYVSLSNLVSNVGVVATDTAGVGTVHAYGGAAPFGTDKAIFAFGTTDGSVFTNISNVVSNTGVVATDTAGVGTARFGISATSYGTDKAVFALGFTTVAVSTRNLVSNVGVIAADLTSSATARYNASALTYGGDKAIIAFGGTNAATKLSTVTFVRNDGFLAGESLHLSAVRFNCAAGSY